VSPTVISLDKPWPDDSSDLARANRERLTRVFTVNLMAAPGAGKTRLILALAQRLAPEIRVGVVEGDVASTVDADALAAVGIPVVQINTHGTCHLEAGAVGAALAELPLAELDLLFIENVGNLICPVAFDLGADCAMVLASVPEGSDKPLKYPAAFAAADVVVITKTDLAPWCPFEREAFERALRALNPQVPLFAVSSAAGAGLEPLTRWLGSQVNGT